MMAWAEFGQALLTRAECGSVDGEGIVANPLAGCQGPGGGSGGSQAAAVAGDGVYPEEGIEPRAVGGVYRSENRWQTLAGRVMNR